MQDQKLNKDTYLFPIPLEAIGISGIFEKPVIALKVKKNKIIIKGIKEPKKSMFKKREVKYENIKNPW